MLVFTTCEGPEGLPGQTGKDGETPTIEIIDGTWWINGVDTGIPVTGEQGEQGEQGLPGDVDPDCQHFWWTGWVQTIARTCTEGAEESRKCIACPHIERRVTSNPLGHNVTTWVTTVPATCLEQGERTGDCARVGCEVTGITGSIPALGHVLEANEITLQPTETMDGAGTAVCSREGCATPSFSFIAPAWNKFYGTWFFQSTGSLTSTTVIDKNNFDITDNDGDFGRFSITDWTLVVNSHSTTQINYPSGYQFSGTNTSSTSYYNYSSFSVYLHNDGQSLRVQRGTTNPPLSNNYIKQ